MSLIVQKLSIVDFSWLSIENFMAIQFFIRPGADCNPDSRGTTPSTPTLIRSGNIAMANVLLDKGARLRGARIDYFAFASALHLAAQNKNYPGDLESILDSGIYGVDHKDRHGDTALSWAADVGNIDAVKLLLKRGANANAVNVFYTTPIYKAAQRGELGICYALIQHGADVQIVISSRDSNIEKAKVPLLKHLAKLQALNRPISRKNCETIEQLEGRHREQYEMYRAELIGMKERIVEGTVTFFDILTAPDIGCYARTDRVVRAFGAQNIRYYFPIYCDDLTRRFSEEVEKQNLIRSAAKGLGRILRLHAETFQDIFHNILQYLDDEDLDGLKIVGD